jgi:hypothetical protein
MGKMEWGRWNGEDGMGLQMQNEGVVAMKIGSLITALQIPYRQIILGGGAD